MSASKTLREDCLKVRETMFEFLKRKKHNELQISLKEFNESSKIQQYSNKKSSNHEKETHSKVRSSSMYEDIVIEEHATIPLISVNKNKFTHTASVTPRRITFAADVFDQKPQSSRRPLLQMISPIKNINKTANKHPVSLSKPAKETQRQKNQSNPRKSILKSNLHKNNSQQFSKKYINTSINSLKENFQRIFEAGQIAKEKNSELSVALINFIKDLQKNRGKENFSIDKKLGEVKYILNALHSTLEIFKDPTQAKQVLEEFEKSFTEHLNDLEVCSNHNMKTQYEQEIIRISSEKQEIIDSLTDQKEKLQREVQKLNRLIEKTSNDYETEFEHQNERQKNLLMNIQNLKRENEENLQLSAQKLNHLQRELQKEIQNSKNLEKQLKNILYKQQKSLAETQVKHTEQLVARQSFLLKQMQNLRHTFNVDISQLHKLYESKQLQYEQKIQKLNQQLEKEKYERKCDHEISERILAEANINRSDAIKIAKKNQELVQDLYRINEDLFQHWLALKDVKTLSERLHIFQHFERIYLDLGFNPNLFGI